MRIKTVYFGQIKFKRTGDWSTVTVECETKDLAQSAVARVTDMLKEPPAGIRIIKATTTYTYETV